MISLVGPSGAVYLITWTGGCKNVPCVDYVDPPVVIVSYLLLAHLCMRLTLRLADCEDQSMRCCAGAEITSAMSCTCQNCPLDMTFVKLIGSCFDVVWSWPLVVLVLGLLGGSLVQGCVRRCLWFSLGNLFGAISDHSLWLPLWCVWEGPHCAPRLALLAQVPEAGQQKFQACWDLPLPARCLLDSVTEIASVGTQVVWGRFIVSHQVGVSGIQDLISKSVDLVVNSDLMSCFE